MMKNILFIILLFSANTLFAQTITLSPTRDETAPLITSTGVQVTTLDNLGYCRIIPTTSGLYTISSSSSSDPYCYLYNNAGTQLDVNDDYSGLDFSIFYSLESGNTYYLGIADYYGIRTITLNITGGGLLPVELLTFSGKFVNKNVILNWKTATEKNNFSFEIERSVFSPSNSYNWVKAGTIQGHGTTNSPKEYSFIDQNIPNGSYSYRLKQIDIDGKSEYSKIINVLHSSPLSYSLGQNYPNPFNPSTTISYQLPADEFVTLKVYSVLGEEVATLVNEVKKAGAYTIDFSASSLTSGVYIYKIEAGSFTQIKKMTVIK